MEVEVEVEVEVELEVKKEVVEVEVEEHTWQGPLKRGRRRFRRASQLVRPLLHLLHLQRKRKEVKEEEEKVEGKRTWEWKEIHRSSRMGTLSRRMRTIKSAQIKIYQNRG